VAEPVAGVAPARRSNAIAPLRHPAYARLWSGAFVSNIGTWMETLALGVYVTKHTGQAAWTGTIAAAGFVPIAFFGPIGGALADRFPRKFLLMTTTFVQTGLATLLTVLFIIGHPSAPILTVIAFGNGICAGLGFPAFQAILPDLVPLEDLPGAIALSSAQYNLGRVVGPYSRAQSSRSAATRSSGTTSADPSRSRTPTRGRWPPTWPASSRTAGRWSSRTATGRRWDSSCCAPSSSATRPPSPT